MKEKELIRFLEHRIECTKAFLADCHNCYGLDIEMDILLAERELLVLEEILNAIK